ncbi:hypothetical protein GCM10018793_16410 [Streptomyces sulfonofaciens]|uniref:Uncharacterized protein n=1 Tax=Streptomyces sulfonofaciens TaxID=68272 RepID=A0A919FY88_9ACTN|nr:hypothetical protein GCM10018793_16410 [Streptomyces sulfonofaciens]
MASGPWPRYVEVPALISELRECVALMVAESAPRVPALPSASERSAATGTLTEARPRRGLDAGESLQSSADQARSPAVILREVPALHTRRHERKGLLPPSRSATSPVRRSRAGRRQR